jgi:hypothetical protein
VSEATVYSRGGLAQDIPTSIQLAAQKRQWAAGYITSAGWDFITPILVRQGIVKIEI